ncbi:MAG TPA: hypothetical protein VGR37_08625 [Longimicrobiaceae bacterium]|nr:hypothetical protein [Longimicrobiaceae bacterium]
MILDPSGRRIACRLRSPRTLVPLFAAVLFLVSCDELTSELERSPDEVHLSEIIGLFRVNHPLPLTANGASEDTLLAVLPPGASPRVVTFSTTAGSFRRTAGAREIKVRAERDLESGRDRLVARAVLVSDTIPRVATVSATVAEFTTYLQVPFVKAP